MSRRDDVIAEIARRHGICLPPDDPILQIDTMLELSETRIEVLVQRIEQAQQPTVMMALPPDQLREFCRSVTQACWSMAPQLMNQMRARSLALLIASHVAVMLLAVCVTHWGIDGRMLGMQCGYQSGQWACWAPAPPLKR